MAAGALLTVVAGSGSAFGVEAEGKAAAERVLATMSSALGSSPEIALRRAQVGTEAAEALSATGAGTPSLSWQREGIGSGFDRRPNAADYFRVTLPVNYPWQVGSHRDLRAATERLLQSGELSSRLEVATLAARRWLDLAASAELEELAGRRVDRLERAVKTQTRRYELGEISGFERTQLERALARERAALRRSEVLRHTAEQELAAVAPDGFAPPVGGDLTRLAGRQVSPLPSDSGLEVRRDEAPVLQLAAIRGELAGAEARSQRWSAWGRPELELEWERIPDLGAEGGYDAAGFRIAFPLPLGRQGKQSRLAAELRAEAAVARQDRLERQLAARLDSAIGAAEGAAAALELLEVTDEGLPTTEHSLAEQFRLGAVSYVVYLDGLSRLDEVRRALIETRLALLSARLELALLLGGDAYFPMPDLEGEGS
jgi:outer membrane protein TolC